MRQEQCPICRVNTAEIKQETKYEGYESINCPRCGKCYMKKFLPQFIKEDKSNFYKVSSWIREQNDIEKIEPKTDEKKFDEILNQRDKKIQEKFNLMINFLNDCSVELVSMDFNSSYETDISNIKDEYEKQAIIFNQIVISKCWLTDFIEFKQLFKKALDDKLIMSSNFRFEKTSFSFNGLTFDGLQYIEELEEPNKDSKKIFVAFNFADELKPIFNTQVKEAVEETGFTHKIVNQETTPHDQKITDEIVAQIKSSRMIIADFTGSSTNVYFEAGFAMGMKIPVIWTCKEGHKFSFDTGQFPHITWKDGDDLKQQLVNRIQAIM